MLVAILALSAIIAILGIVNTLALSVFERTHELGLLRVVGMSRREVRRMVRWESVVIAVVGGVVGVALGVLWGWAFARVLRDQGLSVFRIPVLRGGAVPRRVRHRGRHRRGAPGLACVAARRPRGDRDRVTDDRSSDKLWSPRCRRWRSPFVTAGGCLSVPTASVAPRDLSSGHTVLLVGDSLMGGAAAQLPQVLHDFRVGGISIVDAHRNGSGLVRLDRRDDPGRLRRGQFEARPDIDIVAMEWAGACQKPCPDYGTTAFFPGGATTRPPCGPWSTRTAPSSST